MPNIFVKCSTLNNLSFCTDGYQSVRSLTHMVRFYISAAILESYWNQLTSENGYYTLYGLEDHSEMEWSRIIYNPQRNSLHISTKGNVLYSYSSIYK